MDYLLKASGLVIILFLFYYIFLKNETFFKSIRAYFLLGLLIIIIIPIVEIPIYVEQLVNQLNTLKYSDLQISVSEVEENSINWKQIATIIYLVGVLFFCIKFFIQLISLGNLLSKQHYLKQGKFYFVETSKNVSPFSFFNIIIFNKSQFTTTELKQIINHEKAHVLQWHSADTILAHLLVITLWFNPFVWLYKKAIQQNLEFLADEYALKQTQNHRIYQLALLKTCNTNFCTEITNNFYNSLIKTRIIMLQKNRSTKNSQWKYALFLPILFVFMYTFSTKTIAQQKKLIEIEEIDNLKIELLLDKNSTNETLKKEADFFKKEVDINIVFKGIKRNSNNEIIAIKINAKGENIRSKFENSGTEPIKPIKIIYNSNTNSITIGNVIESHDNKHFSYTVQNDENLKFKEKTWTVKKDFELDEDSNKSENIIYFSTHGNDSLKTEKIILKGKGKNVWIQKNNDSTKIKLIEELRDSLHSNKDYNVKIHKLNYYIGEDAAIEIKNKANSENVFIFKTDENNINEHKIIKSENSVFIETLDEKPIFFIGEKEINQDEMEAINPDSIESINVLKGKEAIAKYGEKGKNGVVKIKLKVNNSPNKTEPPLYIVDSIETTSKAANDINPDKIKAVNVLKGKKNTDKYGDKGKNGVIEITTKKE